MSVYCFDIDGTICETHDGDYANAQPIPVMVEHVNHLHSEGNRIIFWTARGSITGIDWRGLTEKQLKGWGVSYHELHFGKPYADYYIDDRAMTPEAIC